MASVTIRGFDEQGHKHEVKLQTDGDELRVLADRAHTIFQELVPHDVIAAEEPGIEELEPIIDSDRQQQAYGLAERLMTEVSWSRIEKHAKIADYHPDANHLMNDIYNYLTTP